MYNVVARVGFLDIRQCRDTSATSLFNQRASDYRMFREIERWRYGEYPAEFEKLPVKRDWHRESLKNPN